MATFSLWIREREEGASVTTLLSPSSYRTMSADGSGAGEHTLSGAVADGVLGAETAFCGLRADDVVRLSARYGEAQVLVRLRNAEGDARTVMPIVELLRWMESGEEVFVDERPWKSEDIRDVFPLPAQAMG